MKDYWKEPMFPTSKYMGLSKLEWMAFEIYKAMLYEGQIDDTLITKFARRAFFRAEAFCSAVDEIRQEQEKESNS